MKLLEHAVIAGMPVRNRILRSATWEALADAEGYMSENSTASTISWLRTKSA